MGYANLPLDGAVGCAVLNCTTVRFWPNPADLLAFGRAASVAFRARKRLVDGHKTGLRVSILHAGPTAPQGVLQGHARLVFSFFFFFFCCRQR